MSSAVTAFACLLCSYSSDRKSNLESHVKTIHEKVKVSEFVTCLQTSFAFESCHLNLSFTL